MIPKQFIKEQSKQSIYNTIKFQTLSEFISYLGGLLQILFISFQFLAKYYNETSLWLKLSRQFFLLHIHDENSEQADKSSSEIKEMRDVKEQNLAGNEIEDEQFKKKLLRCLAKTKIIMPQLKLTKFHIIIYQDLFYKYNMSLQKTKTKLFGVETCHLNDLVRLEYIQVSISCNIYRYMIALNDIEKLKRLLLNENQLTIFNFKRRQDVIILKNNQNEYVSKKGYGRSLNKIIDNEDFIEPLFNSKLEMQLESYLKLWKKFKIVKLESQDSKFQSHINKQLIQFLRLDLREVFYTQLSDQLFEQQFKELSFSFDKKEDQQMDSFLEQSLHNKDLLDSFIGSKSIRKHTLQQRKSSLISGLIKKRETIFTKPLIIQDINQSEISQPLWNQSPLNNEQLVDEFNYDDLINGQNLDLQVDYHFQNEYLQIQPLQIQEKKIIMPKSAALYLFFLQQGTIAKIKYEFLIQLAKIKGMDSNITIHNLSNSIMQVKQHSQYFNEQFQIYQNNKLETVFKLYKSNPQIMKTKSIENLIQEYQFEILNKDKNYTINFFLVIFHFSIIMKGRFSFSELGDRFFIKKM